MWRRSERRSRYAAGGVELGSAARSFLGSAQLVRLLEEG
jgi:hypothetical protein